VATVGAVSVAPSLPLWLARAAADVMVLHEPNPMALLAYAIARPATPLIVWMHSEVIRTRLQYRVFYKPLLDFALRRAQRIVVASPPMLNIPALAHYQRKCTVIPTVSSARGIGCHTTRAAAFRRFGLEPRRQSSCSLAGWCPTRAWMFCSGPSKVSTPRRSSSAMAPRECR
jgi:hypothetical protein